MPQDIKRKIFEDLGLEQAGVGYESFASKFDNDLNVRKNVFKDLGLEEAGLSFDSFEEKVGLKKKEQAMPFDGQKFGGKSEEPLLPLTSSTVSPSVSKQPKSTTPSVSTGGKESEIGFKPDLTIPWDKAPAGSEIIKADKNADYLRVKTAKSPENKPFVDFKTERVFESLPSVTKSAINKDNELKLDFLNFVKDNPESAAKLQAWQGDNTATGQGVKYEVLQGFYNNVLGKYVPHLEELDKAGVGSQLQKAQSFYGDFNKSIDDLKKAQVKLQFYQNNFIESKGYGDIVTQGKQVNSKLKDFNIDAWQADTERLLADIEIKKAETEKYIVDGSVPREYQDEYAQAYGQYESAVNIYNEHNNIPELQDYNNNIQSLKNLDAESAALLREFEGNSDYKKAKEDYEVALQRFESMKPQAEEFKQQQPLFNDYIQTAKKVSNLVDKIELSNKAFPAIISREETRERVTNLYNNGYMNESTLRNFAGIAESIPKAVNSINAGIGSTLSALTFGQAGEYNVYDKMADYYDGLNKYNSTVLPTMKSYKELKDGSTKWDFAAIGFQGFQQIGNMAIFATLGRYGKAPMVVTGYMMSRKDRENEAKEAGLTGLSKEAYVSTLSSLEGLSELVMPDSQIFTKEIKQMLLKDAVLAQTKGINWFRKQAFKRIAENTGKEVTEEFIVKIGELMQKVSSNYSNGNIFDVSSYKDVNSWIETAAVTAPLTILASSASEIKTPKIELEQARFQAAKNLTKSREVLDDLVSAGNMTTQKADDEYKKIVNYAAVQSVMPVDISPAKAVEVAPLIIENKKLEIAKESGIDEVFKKQITEKIKENIAKAEEILSRPEEAQIEEVQMPEDIASLKDDEIKVIPVNDINDVPEAYRDRVKFTGELKGTARSGSFLGLFGYGKKVDVSKKSYSYTVTGKEIKEEWLKQNTIAQEGIIAGDAGVEVTEPVIEEGKEQVEIEETPIKEQKAEEAVSESKSSEPSKSDKNYQEAQEANSIVSKENPNASVLIQPKGEDLSLTAIYVGKEKRGKGIGSKVLESVKKQANKLGKKVVLDATNELDEETDLERLGNFYEKNGFKKVGENKYEYDPKAKDSSRDIGSRADDSRAKKSDIAADTNKKQPSENVSVPTKEEVVQVETNKQQEDAVQKQTAGQVPVQPEAEVGEGVKGGKPEAEPKEATEESKVEEIGSGLLNFLGIPLEASTEGEVKFSKTTGEPQVLISTEEKEKQIVDQMNKMNLVNEGIDLVAPSTTEEKIDVDELNSRLDNPLKTIEWADYEGMPFTFTISDQLRTGDSVNPNTGQTVTDLKGGIGFNGTKGNENNAWANTTKDEAETMLQRAKDVYANNKPLFDKLWKEGKLPDGHIPMAVVKMAETSILSNEAVFRVGIQNIETLPKTNRKKAVSELAKSMQAKINTESASLKRGVDKNGKPYTENTIKLKKKGINQYQKILDSINNNKYDDIVDILKDKDNFSLPEKSLIANEVFYGSPTPIGGKGIDILRSRPSTPVSKALIGNKNPSLINLGKITDLLTEPSMKNVPNMHVVSVVGVDVKATEVNKINHPNYPYGVKGVSIGVLKNPVHMKDAFGEAYGSALGQVVKNEAANASVSVKSALTQGIPVQSGLPNRVFKSAIARGELDAVDKLAGFLRQAFPSTTFFTSNEAWDAAMADPSIKKKLKDGDVVYAFTTDGNVFINPSLKTTKATLHETGHIWMGFIKENNPNLYAKGLSLVDGTKEYAKAKEQYGDTELAREEALMELMSSKGDTIVNAAQKAKFKEWLLSIYKYIANNFNSLLGLSPKEIENLTLDKFLEGMLADVLSGKELTTKKIKGKVKFSLESQNEKIKEYIDAQRKAGQTDKNIRTGIEMVADRLGLSALDIDNLMDAEKIENSKKAFEFWLNLGSKNEQYIVSAKMKSEAAKAGVDEKSLKSAAKTMKNIDEIRKKLLGAEVIKTIDCKWG